MWGHANGNWNVLFGDDLPSEDAWLVVMTNQRALLDTELENIHFTDKKPKEVLEMISKRGFSEVILAGGEKLNASFLKEDLIDEIRIIVKPLVIGTGKSLFGENESIQKFAFSKSELLGNGSIELIFNKKFT
ncbi:MAG: hypothetical protein COY80_03225 [Candidatus Pacebacteria bacterium CG_4_10_14_0_8_um_filter_42_14]|nr:MAG: hypothetical protein COY80_03225 [Candidatus Pacebacteria bacterium CG_4_10_14_0_8_um_filter_42_14]